MTIKQAIKILSSDTSFEAVKELQYYAGFDKDKVVEQIQEAMNMGAEALEKQIPKKPIFSRLYATTPDMNCPVCGNMLITYPKHCEECGQKIDWGD